MAKPRPTLAQEIAEAAVAFQQETTGHAPKAVTVVLSQDTLVIALHDALSRAEKDLSKSPSGAGQVREFHQHLFSTSSQWLLKQIERVTGVEWHEAVVEVEPVSGDVVQAFARSAKVQVFRMAPSDTGKARSGRNAEKPLTEGGRR